MSFQVRSSVDVYIVQPGKNSKLEVSKKYVVREVSVSGTTNMIGTGLKARMTGFSKTSGSPRLSISADEPDASTSSTI